MTRTIRHTRTTLRDGGRASRRRLRTAKLLLAVLVMTFLPASPALAQATRTWVSGVGDDANPCSRTAPCKTFAGAISKTAPRGEINVLDPGGFGGVSITKSITIQACNSQAGVLVSGTNAIVVNAGPNDTVNLRCLDVNGIGTGLHGIRVLAAKSVNITDSDIYGFVRNGVDIQSSTGSTTVLLARNFIHKVSGAGVMVAPPSGGTTRVTLRDNDISGNGCGVVATQFGTDPAFNYNVNCGTLAPNEATGTAVVNSVRNLFSDVRIAVLSRGANSINRIGDNDIFDNIRGLRDLNNGQVLSFGGNRLAGNVVDGVPTGTINTV